MTGNCTNAWVKALSLMTLMGALLATAKLAAQNGLQVTYGNKGIQTLTYNGVLLEDVGANSADSFHIWHMKSQDLSGNALYAGQYGWGESNDRTTWNTQSQTETYFFNWGSIATQFVQRGNTLDMIVTETNYPGSNIAFDGAEIYPLALHFPVDPLTFSGYTQYAITTTGPGVSAADFGTGVVTSVIPNEALAMYGGWKAQGNNTYTPLMATTAPDGLATFLPHNDAPVQPGSSLSYTVSLRFTPEGMAADASDAYASFAATYPNQMTWSDRRIIGTAYLASSPGGTNITQPGGFPRNPRRYFNDASVDIYSPSGLQAFQQRMLAQAGQNVSTAQALGGQGVITWDVEGEQYPQNTSYVCSPDQISSLAPEMESTILDFSSAYNGMPLVDAYFKTMSDAGLKTGVCLRPQVFRLNGDGTANQSFLTGNGAIIANLENKAKYANARWGTTIFYVDSTVDGNGGTLDPAIFQQVLTDLPSFLFIPEESTPRYYAYTAPFYSFIFHTTLGTPAAIYNVYPKAFGANLVNDVSAGVLAQYTPQLTQSVSHGDILMGHADYWQANDPTLVSIYAAAGNGAPAPVQVTPNVSWPAPAAISFGTALSGQQLDATASTAGTFTYSPAPGSVLNAGTSTLTATFTPADTVNYKAVTASTSVTVTQASPAIFWGAPASIALGTALSGLQLNATASVPGSFTYTPGAGVMPGLGNTMLQVVFTPYDTTDYQAVTTYTTINVTQVQQTTPLPNGKLAIVLPMAGSTVSGTIVVQGYVNLPLDPAGSFLIVDGQWLAQHRVTSGPYLYTLDTTTLSDGPHVLQLWAHDIGNNTTISSGVQINVAN